MRVHLARGDASAALQVYATLRARLAEELQVKPSAETVALVEHIRATAAASRGSAPFVRPPPRKSRPPGELVAPLVGRAAAFHQLVGLLSTGAAGAAAGCTGGRARLVLAKRGWPTSLLPGPEPRARRCLVGQAFEMGGRLPYQPLVEAVRQRLEAENAPEDLLDDLWLAELSRLATRTAGALSRLAGSYRG